jgi:hypothetical protein
MKQKTPVFCQNDVQEFHLCACSILYKKPWLKNMYLFLLKKSEIREITTGNVVAGIMTNPVIRRLMGYNEHKTTRNIVKLLHET